MISFSQLVGTGLAAGALWPAGCTNDRTMSYVATSVRPHRARPMIRVACPDGNPMFGHANASWKYLPLESDSTPAGVRGALTGHFDGQGRDAA